MLRGLLDLELMWKAAPGLALVAAVVWPFLCTDATLSPALFAVLCASFAAVGEFHRRATLFEAALPIPGRQLVAKRLLVVFAVLWLPALAMTGVTLVLRGWKDALPLLTLAAVVSLAVLVVQSFRIRQASHASWIVHAPWLALSSLFLVPGGLSHWGAVLGVSFAASAVLLARLWVSVPEGFQIAPAEARRVTRFRWRHPSSRRVWLPVWWPAWRSFFRWGDLWGWIMCVVCGAMTGWLLMFAGWLVFPVVTTCQRLEWLLVLPVSRRGLLFMMTLPSLCTLMAIVSLPGHFGLGRKAPMVSTGYSDTWPDEKAAREGTPNVLVPASFWRWAGGAAIPAIESPWGEKTEPRTFHRLGMVFYNPYSVAPSNSARFLDWQFARATKAVYGRGVPLSQSAELQKPGWIPIPRQLRTHFVAVLAATLVFLGMLHVQFWRKIKASPGWTLLTWLCVSAPFFIDALTAPRVQESGSLSEVITIQLAAILPQNWAALIALATLLVGSLYLAVEKQFKRIDLIPKLRHAKGEE